jgi:hypothetical protein
LLSNNRQEEFEARFSHSFNEIHRWDGDLDEVGQLTLWAQEFYCLGCVSVDRCLNDFNIRVDSDGERRSVLRKLARTGSDWYDLNQAAEQFGTSYALQLILIDQGLIALPDPLPFPDLLSKLQELMIVVAQIRDP